MLSIQFWPLPFLSIMALTNIIPVLYITAEAFQFNFDSYLLSSTNTKSIKLRKLKKKLSEKVMACLMIITIS